MPVTPIIKGKHCVNALCASSISQNICLQCREIAFRLLAERSVTAAQNSRRQRSPHASSARCCPRRAASGGAIAVCCTGTLPRIARAARQPRAIAPSCCRISAALRCATGRSCFTGTGCATGRRCRLGHLLARAGLLHILLQQLPAQRAGTAVASVRPPCCGQHRKDLQNSSAHSTEL